MLLSLESAVGSSLVFEHSPEELYCHQFNAVAKPGDLLIAFAPLGTEKIVLNTISHAVNKEVNVIALTGSNNDAIQGILADSDLENIDSSNQRKSSPRKPSFCYQCPL